MKKKRAHKAKTHKGLAARIKITKGAKPKIMRKRRLVGSRTKASKSTKLKLRKLAQVSKADTKVIRKLIPGI